MSVHEYAGQSQAQVAAALHSGYPPGSFLLMHEGAMSLAAAIPAVNQLYLKQFTVYAPIVVTMMYQICATLGAGSSVKAGIWRNDYSKARATSVPVISDNTGYDTTSTGRKEFVVSSVGLDRGIYWAGSVTTGTPPVMWSVSINNAGSMGINPSSPIATATNVAGFSVPFTYADNISALDLTGATFSAVGSSGIPIIGLGWV